MDTRLSDIREETSVDLVDESDAETAKDPELDKAIKELFEATKHGWALFEVLERVMRNVCLKILKEASFSSRYRR